MLFDIVRPSEVSDEVPTMKPTSAAGERDSKRAARTLCEGLDVVAQRHARVFPKGADGNDGDDADEPGFERRVFHEQSRDDDEHWDEQMSVAFHNLAHDGKLFFPYPFEMVAARADMDVA